MERKPHTLFDDDFLARLEQLHLLAKRLAAGGASGPRRSRQIGDGLEFADHRDYAAGDDVRFVDWPYYARMEKLLLRLFHQHSDADVMILLDCSASMAPGGDAAKFDYARRLAAAMAYVAMGSLERVTLLPFAQQPAPPLRTGRNRGRILQVLAFLSALQCGGRTELGRCVAEVVAAQRPRGTVLLISDLLDCQDDLSQGLARLAQANDVAVLHVYSPQEATPALSGAVVLQQAETMQELPTHATPQLLESYAKVWQEFRTSTERTCLSRGATYVAADTAVPFETLVLQTLRRLGVVG